MNLKKQTFLEIFFLVAISAAVYLPNISGLTYFKDDWYYVYDGYVAGADVFHDMFSIDRPARGYFFEAYYSLFGPQPLPYHIGAFVWRVLSATGALWLLRLIWPRARKFTYATALLFAVFPGYYWWISGVEYQPMIASLALQVFSFALTLSAMRASSRALQVLSMLGAILSGWTAIALVDYAIGMEAFRFLCIFVLIGRDSRFSSIWRKLGESLRAWAWNLTIPLGFVLWRIFLFSNERKATDIGLQLSGLIADPLGVGPRWFLQFFNSLLNLGILAWVAQFPRFFFGMRLREIATGLFFAALVILLLFLAGRILKRGGDEAGTAFDESVFREAMLTGLLGMSLGILPVVMANRHINLDGFSHYALPASMAAAIFVSGLIFAVSNRRAQTVIMYSLITFAALAHYSISVSAKDEENAIEKFWWQVSWRVPALHSGTTLAINYPSGNIGDDGNGVVEAANMIYFPEASSEVPVRYGISAITLNRSNLQDLLVGKFTREIVYRSHAVSYDYGNVLVLSQPTPSSCVHVIDGNRPVISVHDPGDVILAAPHSNIENVLVDAPPFKPQEFAFGPEPEHSWCYYYEKAELALQRGDFDQVADLGEQAIQLDYHPEDQSEWLPFLLGYALTGNETRVKQTGPKINTEHALRLQACDMLSGIESDLSPEIQALVDELYCRRAE